MSLSTSRLTPLPLAHKIHVPLTHTYAHIHTPIPTTLIHTTNVITPNSLVIGSGRANCRVLNARQSKTKQYATKPIFEVKK